MWAYDFGARTKRRWPAKHDTILVYVKDPAAYHFDGEAVDREPYMAPGLQTAERVARGKAPTDIVVAHDRADHRAREDRLPDPEARGDRAADRAGVVAAGRVVPGLLRRARGRSARCAGSSAAATSSSTATPRRCGSCASASPRPRRHNRTENAR